VSLGSTIRELRLAHGFTLVALAERSGLSQPFLSQVENDRARPSVDSLYRIATALGTTPQALFDDEGSDSLGPATALRDDPAVPTLETEGESVRRMLLRGDAPFHVVELVGLSTEFLETWEHDGFEALYVVAGPIDVEIGGEVSTLSTGDFVSYPSSLPHRYRSPLGSAARVLLMETQLQRTQQGTHTAPTTPPTDTTA
jgi:transcriptional regulator with XRE-family HTH domain